MWTRLAASGDMVMLEFIIAAGGGPDFYTARAYTPARHLSDYYGRTFVDGKLYGDLAYPSEDPGAKAKRKGEHDIYRLIDSLFPELIGYGLKSQGYVKYTLDHVAKSGVKMTV